MAADKVRPAIIDFLIASSSSLSRVNPHRRTVYPLPPPDEKGRRARSASTSLLELPQLVTVRDTTLRYVARWANPAIAVTLAGSAALNSFAFMQGAAGALAIAAAAAMGCFLPGFIYVLTRVSAHLAHH
jgi:hypothetical protein